jgi:hypothetical protein
MIRRPRSLFPLLLLPILLLSWGCASVTTIREDSPALAYASPGRHTAAAEERWSPVFLVHNTDDAYNRIGSPVASFDKAGEEMIRIDPDRPVLYWESRAFTTEKGAYTNLVYRVHFPDVPFNLVPFTFQAGHNPGILIIVTLDAGGKPVLVSQSGTCGCYIAMVPTQYLPKEMLPEDWTGEPIDIYGERLGPFLDYAAREHPRLLFELRPAAHRVMDVRVIDDPPPSVPAGPPLWVDMPLAPEADLDRLPLGNGTTTSLYLQSGAKGYVKGAWRVFETTLMGWWALDFYVGNDKDYGDPDNPFYTSLKPWARLESNMADFPRFLKYWGWRL